MNNRQVGGQGEDRALEFLKENGYEIIGRNVRSRFGEIDVVAKQGRILCFIEVKARGSTRFGWPEEAVSRHKQWQLTRLAHWYVQAHRLTEVPVRFDVVSLLTAADGSPARLRLIRGAFDATA